MSYGCSSVTAQCSQEVRFSLEGLVVPRDTNIPSHVGLHHHGDEPMVNIQLQVYLTSL